MNAECMNTTPKTASSQWRLSTLGRNENKCRQFSHSSGFRNRKKDREKNCLEFLTSQPTTERCGMIVIIYPAAKYFVPCPHPIVTVKEK